MATSPTQRSLEFCRKQGWFPEVTERFIQHFKRDAYGCIDLIALQPGQSGLLGIQATSAPNQAARKKKILEELKPVHAEAVQTWLRCGNRLEVWGWSKKGPRGKAKRWTLTRTEITLDSFRSDVAG